MPLVKEIEYVKEPTDLQCGQAVLAMLSGKTVEEIISLCGTQRETTLRDMQNVLSACGIKFNPRRNQAQIKSDLPPLALLSLETPRCWHWSLFAYGRFYDPEHGVLDDFPACGRRYYWEILP